MAWNESYLTTSGEVENWELRSQINLINKQTHHPKRIQQNKTEKEKKSLRIHTLAGSQLCKISLKQVQFEFDLPASLKRTLNKNE